MRSHFILILTLLAFGLSGCASYKARSFSTKHIGDFSEFFVVNNLSDNHYIDRHLVAALKSHGKEAESGPETMMPEESKVLITYKDSWNWDFSEHLVAMHVEVRDAKYGYLLGAANFEGPVTMKTNPSQVCERLIQELLKMPARPMPQGLRTGTTQATPR